VQDEDFKSVSGFPINGIQCQNICFLKNGATLSTKMRGISANKITKLYRFYLIFFKDARISVKLNP
jgi:hypothetical protein